MKVLVLGSGVIGVSCAWQLMLAGHEVEVIERQPAAGLETSFANAGEVSPGYSSPWAGPGVPLKLFKWLAMKHRPLVIRPQFDLATLRWGLAMLRNCTTERYEINKGRMVRLAEYSRDQLRLWRETTGIRYDERTLGTLQLFRTQQQLDGAATDIEVLQRYRVPHVLLDRAACVAREPALGQVREKFVGGLLLPGDETGDCLQFTQKLAVLAAQRGVRFRYATAVHRLQMERGRVTGVETGSGPVSADACLVALGSHSPQLLRPVGISLPVIPVKGYSLTLPLVDAAGAPESTVMDETHKVAVTRLGSRIRVGGTAEIAGYKLQLHDARRRTLEHVVTDLFPTGGDVARAEFWCGLRPMTPDGTPVLGATKVPGLYLATGHGTLGWTMAAGTGRVLADILSGRRPEIDLEGLGIDRYPAAYR